MGAKTEVTSPPIVPTITLPIGPLSPRQARVVIEIGAKGVTTIGMRLPGAVPFHESTFKGGGSRERLPE